MTEQTEFPRSAESLRQMLEWVSIAAQMQLSKRWHAIEKRRTEGLPTDRSEQKFLGSYDAEKARLEQKARIRPEISYPSQLPVSERRDEIAKLILEHQVVVVAGETGSGKTTQLPKICIEIGLGLRGRIGHTQPRRIAASTVASRVAEELNTPIGEVIGYQVRFSDQSSPEAYVKLMTDGILLAEVQHDPLLLQYDTIIIDEAHERSLNIDFLLGYLKRLLPKRPDLKLIITSATIDLERFSRHFNGAPILEVSGRTYPVEIRYRPPEDGDGDLSQQVIDALAEILSERHSSNSDILVFLSGEREIREVAQAIRREGLKHLEVMPLYARLSITEQRRAFQKHTGRRVVLATNVAETSITVPGIGYVIDPGTARISRYSVRTKVQRLPIEAISQASANQRAGRCGRVSNGVCIRLYSEEDLLRRPAFTDAEILRTNLASVVLSMLTMGVGEIRRFPFLDAPDPRLIKDAFKLLEELKAVDGKGELTALGKSIAQLPIDPRLGRMLLAGAENDCLAEVLIIASALAVQDPRERPHDKQQAADEAHRRFWDDGSDFVAWINLWHYAEQRRAELSQNQWRKQAAKEYLNILRLREWRDLHHQVRVAARKLNLRENSQAADYTAVHGALLTGLISNIATLDGEKSEVEYLGTRNRKLAIFPGSGQFKKRPKWLMAAEMIETTKVYAHTVARIEPEWLLKCADHLLKYHYYEPHYSVKNGQVMAFARITLLGLILADKKRTNFSQINPSIAREVFIRQALVEGAYAKARPSPGKFFKVNQARCTEVEVLEAKARRRDILVDDEALYRFYDERLPDHIVNLAGFEHWRKQAERQNPKLLEIPVALLMHHAAEDITQAQYPNAMIVEGMELPLNYHFEPGHADDGVSIGVPVDILHSIPPGRLQWLVPGMLRDKCIAMVRALPKQWRKRFVPVPDFIDRAMPRMTPSNTPLTEVLAEQLGRLIGDKLPSDIWDEVEVEDFYKLNIHVLDDRGEIIARGRDLARLHQQYRQQVRTSIRHAGEEFEREALQAWDFEELPKEVSLKRGAVTVKAYPALVTRGDEVDLRVFDNPLAARYASQRGAAKLLAKKCNKTVKYLQKNLLKNKDIGLSLVDLGSKAEVVDDIILAAIRRCALEDGLPVTRQQFESAAAKLGELTRFANELEGLLLGLLKEVVAIRRLLKESKNPLPLAFAFNDVQNQLTRLFYKDFLFITPWQWLSQYPRYLAAILVRLEKVAQQPQKDRALAIRTEALWAAHAARLEAQGEPKYWANEAWQKYRWMIEELRVSMFAQVLGTALPVSEKRLEKLWQESLQ